jgi:hypothetical protein
LCQYLLILPEVIRLEDFQMIIARVREIAEEQNIVPLLNWLDHKDRNPWVLQNLSSATTKMNRGDWFSTSAHTNIGEANHAYTQVNGKGMSLYLYIN